MSISIFARAARDNLINQFIKYCYFFFSIGFSSVASRLQFSLSMQRSSAAVGSKLCVDCRYNEQ